MRTAASLTRSYYRLLLLAYPRAFRRRHADEAADIFAAACRDSLRRGGIPAWARRVLHAGIEVPRRGFSERFRGGPAPRRKTRRHATSFLTDFFQDLRFAARSLRRRPVWALAIAATLGLGIGANTAIFSVVDATLLASSPWPNADRLVWIDVRTTEGTTMSASLGELYRWREEVDVFERFEAIDRRTGVLGHETGARRVSRGRVTPGYLDALDVEPITGRLLRADDARLDASPVVVVPERAWRRLYNADPQIVGKVVELDGVAHVVIGVLPSVRDLVDVFFTPLPPAGGESAQASARGLAWLRSEVSPAQARAQLEAVSAGEHERWGRYRARLTPQQNAFWEVDEFRSGLLSLLAAVFLVLMIACVNVGNLLLAAAGTRRGELAVRAALGAGRGRLVRFMLAESLLLSGIGAILGLVIAFGGLALMLRFAPSGSLGAALQLVELDGTVLAYTAVIALLSGLAFGLLPALRSAPEARPGTMRNADGRATGGQRRLGGAMVAIETALCLVLLIAAGLTARSFVQLRFLDPGFDADRILALWIMPPATRYPTEAEQSAFFTSLIRELERVPGVAGVKLGAGVVPPSDLATGGAITIAGRETAVNAMMTFSMVQPDILEFMGIALLAGRDIDGEDLRRFRDGAERSVVVNRALADLFWPDGDALGSRFLLEYDYERRWNRVVGIAADVRQRGLEGPKESLHLYQPLGSDLRSVEVLVRLAPGVPPPIAELRAAINRLDPQVPTETLDTAAAGLLDGISGSRFRAALFGTFGILAVTLAAVGVFGVVACSVVQRTREMGIRLALGAEPREVRRLVLLQGATPVLAGIGLGLPLSLAMTRGMTAFLHGVAPTDPLTFVGTAAALTAVGLLATWIPARRATAVDPALTLRNG